MKRGLTVAAIVLVIIAGIFIALRMRVAVDVTAAASSESKGDYSAALNEYVNALNAIVPSRPVPDVNRSKVVTPASWKKEMEEYGAWVAGTSTENVDRTKMRAAIEAVRRNAARVSADNFLSNASVKRISVEQFKGLWNGAYFARGVAIDSGHGPLAAATFGRSISIIQFSAHTSFTYEMSLIDTASGRRTTFSVYPETSAFVLAVPGDYLLICKSWYQPAPTQIWRSAPSVMSVVVPQKPSLVSFTLETQVVRSSGKR